MSILYGFVNLDGRPAEPKILDNMGATLKDKKTDAHMTFLEGNTALGFYNQYITAESWFEKQPYCAENAGLYCICDAIIDNREELALLLGLKLTKELPDGKIIFESYKKWGKDCTNYLLGDFAFVVCDRKNHRVQLFRDHMGKRLIYYRFVNHCIYFSTLIKPLINLCGNGEKPKLNEEYLVFFLAIPQIRHDIITGSTIYRDINYVAPASCLTVSQKSMSNVVYWDPLTIRPDWRLKKTNYVEEFKSIFTEAVKCRLRADGNVGVSLSGGLDSSSVACVAASILKDQNRELHTYTSVPRQGFNNWAPRHIISDESDAVKIMQAAFTNMNGHFIDSLGKNPLNVACKMLDVFEQPYKFIDNSYWLDDLYQNASRDGCRVILNGRSGNSTVSFGSYDIIFFQHIMKLRWLKLFQDINALCRIRQIGRIKTSARVIGGFLRSIFFSGKGSIASEYVNTDYLEKYNVEKTLRAFGLAGKPAMSISENRRRSFHPTLLNQGNSAVAKLCIASDICDRDPTGDKRVVEFCLKLPYECFFDKTTGQDRGLIRRAMSGIVPDQVLQNQKYGQQAVDWLERVEPQWKDFISSFNEVEKRENGLFSYLNYDHIEEVIRNNTELTYSYDTIFNVRNIIIIDNCVKFLDML